MPADDTYQTTLDWLSGMFGTRHGVDVAGEALRMVRAYPKLVNALGVCLDALDSLMDVQTGRPAHADVVGLARAALREAGEDEDANSRS